MIYEQHNKQQSKGVAGYLMCRHTITITKNVEFLLPNVYWFDKALMKAPMEGYVVEEGHNVIPCRQLYIP